MKMLMLVGLFVIGVVPFGGCSLVEDAIDCKGNCDRYQTCFDATYDTTGCQSRCRANASSDVNYRAKSEACSACISDKSCVSATFTCATDCIGIVP